MLELSLFGQIPASRHDQVLNILAGIAAMPPSSIRERHFLFKPTRQPARAAVQVGGSQGIQDAQKAARQSQTQSGADLYHLRLVEDLDYRSAQTLEGYKNENQNGKVAPTQWSLKFYDVPEPGRRAVVTRAMSVTPILEGDALAFMAGLGYHFVHKHVVRGHRVVHNNVVLDIYRMLHESDSEPPPDKPANSHTLDMKNLTAVDESGGFILQAYVRVQDGSTPDVIARGTTELVQLKELLKGSIDLRVIDRLALDTRVK